MKSINQLRDIEARIITLGSYPGIIQAMLDYDYLSGKTTPSISVIIASGKKYERYFWGEKEILIRSYRTIREVPEQTKKTLNMFVSFASGRRKLDAVKDVISEIPSLIAGGIFAEDVPEQHALEILSLVQRNDLLVMRPASIGLLIPG